MGPRTAWKILDLDKNLGFWNLRWILPSYYPSVFHVIILYVGDKGLVTGDRWHMTFFSLCWLLKNLDFFGYGSTTRQEIQCIPYAKKILWYLVSSLPLSVRSPCCLHWTASWMLSDTSWPGCFGRNTAGTSNWWGWGWRWGWGWGWSWGWWWGWGWGCHLLEVVI